MRLFWLLILPLSGCIAPTSMSQADTGMDDGWIGASATYAVYVGDDAYLGDVTLKVSAGQILGAYGKIVPALVVDVTSTQGYPVNRELLPTPFRFAVDLCTPGFVSEGLIEGELQENRRNFEAVFPSLVPYFWQKDTRYEVTETQVPVFASRPFTIESYIDNEGVFYDGGGARFGGDTVTDGQLFPLRYESRYGHDRWQRAEHTPGTGDPPACNDMGQMPTVGLSFSGPTDDPPVPFSLRTTIAYAANNPDQAYTQFFATHPDAGLAGWTYTPEEPQVWQDAAGTWSLVYGKNTSALEVVCPQSTTLGTHLITCSNTEIEARVELPTRDALPANMPRPADVMAIPAWDTSRCIYAAGIRFHQEWMIDQTYCNSGAIVPEGGNRYFSDDTGIVSVWGNGWVSRVEGTGFSSFDR